jgi:hypothetical protein
VVEVPEHIRVQHLLQHQEVLVVEVHGILFLLDQEQQDKVMLVAQDILRVQDMAVVAEVVRVQQVQMDLLVAAQVE